MSNPLSFGLGVPTHVTLGYSPPNRGYADQTRRFDQHKSQIATNPAIFEEDMRRLLGAVQQVIVGT